MALKLRPTGLGSAINKDRPDYTVYSGECTVGRIYETGGGPDSLRWFVANCSEPMTRSDRVATLEEAKGRCVLRTRPDNPAAERKDQTPDHRPTPLAAPTASRVTSSTKRARASLHLPCSLSPGRRSPPPQNEATDTGQVDRYQREQAYDGTQMVCDDRASAYRLVHRLPKEEPCGSRAEKECLDRHGIAPPIKKRTKLTSVPVEGINLRVVRV